MNTNKLQMESSWKMQALHISSDDCQTDKNFEIAVIYRGELLIYVHLQSKEK